MATAPSHIDAKQAPASTPAPQPTTLGPVAARWYRLNKDKLQATLIGAMSLVAFLIAWHLLTKYRVVFFVRFTQRALAA